MAYIPRAICAILLGMVTSTMAAEPLSPELSVASQVRLEKLDRFLTDYYNTVLTSYFGNCSANSQVYANECANVEESTCKTHTCSDKSFTDQVNCQLNSGSWNEENAPNSVCCSDGNKECNRKKDDPSEELEWGCCDHCLSNPNAAGCTPATFQSVSVCGTTKGKCYRCMGNTNAGEQSSCENSYRCTGTPSGCATRYDQTNCENLNGCTWTQSVWEEVTSATTKDTCESGNHCAHCINDQPNMYRSSELDCQNHGGLCSDTSRTSQADCTNNGGTWTPGTWETLADITDSDSCNYPNTWVRLQTYKRGDELPAAPMNNWEQASSCSTGPDHAEDGSHDGAHDCMTAATFLSDAQAGKGYTEATKANSTYYGKVMSATRVGAVVTNHANAADRAMYNLTSTTCFMVLIKAKNRGRITVDGGASTAVMIHDPYNYEDADPMTVINAEVYVVGGTNKGPINVVTTKKVEVWGVNNSGPIDIKDSQDVVVANVYNGAAATIVVSNLVASLIDIENHGTVTVNTGGKYNVWNAINKGTVTVNAGTINATLICPSSGVVTIATGVTGAIAYEAGCRGTINAPATVTITEIAAKGKTLRGTLDVEVADPDAFLADADAMKSVQEGIAEVAGVPKDWVTITGAKLSRRLHGTDNLPNALHNTGRRLAANLKLSYTISVPSSETSSTVATVESRMTVVTPTEVQTAVQTKMEANSVTGTFVAKTIGTPEVAAAPPMSSSAAAPWARPSLIAAVGSVALTSLLLASGAWL